MNYADIKRVDVANGPGVRVSLFVSGCTHRCEGCFNPETWDFDYGKPFGEGEVQTILALLDKSHIRGLSLLGGEPFEPQNQGPVLDLVRRVRESLPRKDIWCYTGYLFEQLAAGGVGAHSRSLLEMLDVLVDGPFVQEKKNLALAFRGSENQRILDVPASLRAGEVRLAEEYMA
ncbi:MAG: anaerobic ribonucleoside-triphosphate reductase activating protein [Lawsonibacter sp.]|nr:anaerobic ribonucleoside-triphosphate reductase activating protein [Lawsonibacter sp.]